MKKLILILLLITATAAYGQVITTQPPLDLSAGGTIAGDVTVTGTTPSITVGDAGAEDAQINFDGNAQDYHIGLDDTDDALKIGLGTTLGTTSYVTVSSGGDVTIPTDTATLHLGVDDVEASQEIHDAGTLKFWDASDDTGVTLGPVTDGTDDLPVTGDVVISKTLTVTGGNIIFPATAVPVADANTLDDYEEGTYNPTLVCGTSGSFGLAAHADTLAYTKIGQLVAIQGRIQITSDSSCSGQLRLSIPFDTAPGTEFSYLVSPSIVIRDHGDAELENPYLQGESNVSYMALANVTDAGTVENVDNTRVDGAFYVQVSFSYITDL